MRHRARTPRSPAASCRSAPAPPRAPRPCRRTACRRRRGSPASRCRSSPCSARRRRAITRGCAFCTPIANVPTMPATSAGRLSGCVTGVAHTPAAQKPSSSTACTACSVRVPCQRARTSTARSGCSRSRRRRTRGTLSFSTTPWPKPAMPAPISTKLPVTCAVNSPNSATKLSVSTKPATAARIVSSCFIARRSRESRRRSRPGTARAPRHGRPT